MANVKLIFQGSFKSQTSETDLQVFHNTSNEIYLCIDSDGNCPSYICLDKSTAIRFHRELKKQISFIGEEEQHGER
jgi:hypothetical protein